TFDFDILNTKRFTTNPAGVIIKFVSVSGRTNGSTRAMEFTSVSAINTTVEVSPGLVAVGRSTDVTIAVKDPSGRPITGLMSGAFEAKLMVEGVPSATTAVTDVAE